MKSLNYILKNKKTAVLLYIEDLIMFLFLFVPLLIFFLTTTKGNYYSINFTIDYVADILLKAGGLSMYFPVLIAGIIAYLFVRIYLLSGIFPKLLDENTECMKEAGKNFWKFLALFFIYGIILLVALKTVSFPFKKAIKDMYNLKQAFILGNIQKIIQGFIFWIISLFHTAARFKTVKNGKLKVFAKPEKILPFFGYQIIALIITFLGLYLFYKLATTNTYLGYIAAFIIFQAALFFKITFKLSAYKSIA